MKILVVDDSRAMRTIVIRLLRTIGFVDAKFAEAGDGTEAIAAAKAEKPDLVLSDWYMPDMTGLDAVQALRKEGLEVPFAFLTSEASGHAREAAIAAGALFVLPKPFSVQELAQAMKRVFPEKFPG